MIIPVVTDCGLTCITGQVQIDFAYYSGYSSDKFGIAGSSNNDLCLSKMQPTNTFTTTFQRSNLFKPILDSQYTYDTVMLNSDVLPPFSPL